VFQCPRSIIRAEAEVFVETYAAWRLSGRTPVWDYPAKLVDAFLVLDAEWKKEEERSGSQQHIR
jgi:hypothetical protein